MTEITSKKHYVKFEQSSLLLASSNLKLKKLQRYHLLISMRNNTLQNNFEYLLASAENKSPKIHKSITTTTRYIFNKLIETCLLHLCLTVCM